jgi:phospholipid/cholesterol/gamma-HCH transport system substrate-binding protein
METKASYTLVGAFVLGFIGVAIFFVIWLSGGDTSKDTHLFRVQFKNAVTGLTVGAPVRYRGIPVGEVTRIDFAKNDPDVAEVTIKIDVKTPVHDKMVASLETQGLTGAPFIQLKTPVVNGQPLRGQPMAPEKGKEPPIIPGDPTGLEKIFEEFPNAIAAVTELAKRGSAFLTDENAAKFGRILDSADAALVAVREAAGKLGPVVDNVNALVGDARKAVADVSTMLTDTRRAIGEIEKTFVDARAAIASIKGLSDDLRPVAGSIKALADDARPVMKDISTGANAFAALMTEARNLVRENRRPLADFAATGLYEFSLFLTDMRAFIRTFDRILIRLEADPSQFLFGNTQRGYETRGGSRP